MATSFARLFGDRKEVAGAEGALGEKHGASAGPAVPIFGTRCGITLDCALGPQDPLPQTPHIQTYYFTVLPLVTTCSLLKLFSAPVCQR